MKEWRQMAVQSVTSIGALAVWAVSTPIQVRIVSLPVGVSDTGPFGVEFWGGGIVVFVATSLATWLLWTVATERRIPRLRWPFRRRSDPFDPSLLGGLLATALTIFHGWHDLKGLLVLGEHTGAYVWAASNDASFLISYMALFVVGVGVARVLLTIRASRRPRATSSATVPAEPSPG
jgi:hypothetical protein